MPTSTSLVAVDLIAGLKATPVSMMNTLALVVGANTLTDGMGGFYRWDGTSTAAEDTRFFNVVTFNVRSTGRWIRVFQRIRVMPGGYLVANGGYKSYFVTGALNSSGQIVINLTDDGIPGLQAAPQGTIVTVQINGI